MCVVRLEWQDGIQNGHPFDTLRYQCVAVVSFQIHVGYQETGLADTGLQILRSFMQFTDEVYSVDKRKKPITFCLKCLCRL